MTKSAKKCRVSKKLKSSDAINKEVSVGDFIPYSRHLDNHTIKTHSGALLQFIRIGGVSFETKDQVELNRLQEKRNMLFYGISDSRFAIWTTLVRRKESRFPSGNFEETGFAKSLNDKYKRRISSSSMFVNELYLTIIRQPPSGGINKFSDFLKSLSQKGDVALQKKEEQEAVSKLNEVTQKILTNLDDYAPTLLGLKETKNGIVSEPLAFLGYLVNGEKKDVLLPFSSINRQLSNSRPFFGKEAMQIKGLSQNKLLGAITIKEYSGTTRPSIFDKLLTLPCEFVLTQSYQFMARQEALAKMKKQYRQLNQAGDDAVSLTEELLQGIDDLGSGRIGFGDHHFTLFISEANQKELKENLANASSILSDEGITSIKEDIALEAAFWAQLPANRSYISRKSGVSSQNFAAFASFHNYPSGRYDQNHWGQALTLLETVSGSPFYFNFHVADLGNTTIIGPSGSGKTVLMTFLQAQLEKYKHVSRVYLDKDRGAELFIRAIGGHYAIIEPGVKTKFNPFQLEESPENEAFLLKLVSFMLSENDTPLNAVDMNHATRMVKGNWNLPMEARQLANLAAYLPQGKDNHLSLRLNRWYGDGDLAWLFDCEKDEFPHNLKTIGFDLTHILDEPIARAACLRYLFFRVEKLIDGNPFSITLDEGWKGLSDSYVSDKIKDWEKVIRKLNGIVVFGSQSASDLVGTNAGKEIIAQSVTQIFYADVDADYASYCQAFSLSDKEFDMIKNQLNPAERCFLIKQGKNSVVARLNLQGLDDEIAILSSRKETTNLLDRIRAEHGDDPATWIPVFHEMRKQI